MSTVLIILFIAEFITAFLVSLSILFDREEKDRKRTDVIIQSYQDTVEAVLGSVRETSTMFYRKTAEIEKEHFKQVTKVIEKQENSISENVDKIVDILSEKKIDSIEKISGIDSKEKNSIETEEEIINPLQDVDPSMFSNIKGVQFEGREEIYPIATE